MNKKKKVIFYAGPRTSNALNRRTSPDIRGDITVCIVRMLDSFTTLAEIERRALDGVFSLLEIGFLVDVFAGARGIDPYRLTVFSDVKDAVTGGYTNIWKVNWIILLSKVKSLTSAQQLVLLDAIAIWQISHPVGSENLEDYKNIFK